MKNKWYRLDNAAKIFPPNTTYYDPKIFRLSVLLTENINKIFGITRADVTALASVEVSEKEIKYYFFKGPKKNPLAFAERFRDDVGRDSVLAPLKSAIDVDEATFYKADVQKKRKEEPFFDPKEHVKDIMSSPFVDKIVASLKNKLSSEITHIKSGRQKPPRILIYISYIQLQADP